MEQQLSFRTELANLERMRSALATLPVRVPVTYASLCAERVLVMERFDGARLHDLAVIDTLGVDRRTLLTAVVECLIVPALRAGLFHADLHAGNMIVLPDGALGLLDFGVVRRLDDTTRAALSDLLAAVTSRRFDAVGPALFRMVDVDPENLVAIGPELQRVVTECLDRPVDKLDVADATRRILQVAARHGLVLPEALVAFLKQLVYLDGVCRTLQPTFDLLADGAVVVERARAAGPALFPSCHDPGKVRVASCRRGEAYADAST